MYIDVIIILISKVGSLFKYEHQKFLHTPKVRELFWSEDKIYMFRKVELRATCIKPRNFYIVIAKERAKETREFLSQKLCVHCHCIVAEGNSWLHNRGVCQSCFEKGY
jgi:hypothetical protein